MMNLEQVLARWVHDAAAPARAADDASPVAGRWTNEYGSVADLKTDGARISGTFTWTGEGGAVSGPVTGWANGDIVAFSVRWPASTRSITSWVGQVVDDSGGPALKTLWHLVVDIPDAEERTGLWAAVHTGADIFR